MTGYSIRYISLSPGLFEALYVYIYLFEYESKNEIMKYTKYFFIYIYM